MRNRFAMAGGGSGDALVAAPWFAPVLAFASASLTAFVIWAGQRLVGKAAWQTAITAANKDLIDQLQEERRSMREDFETLKRERADEQLMWTQERAKRDGDIMNLTQSLESLKAYLRRNGIEIPEAPYQPPVEMTVIRRGPKK